MILTSAWGPPLARIINCPEQIQSVRHFILLLVGTGVLLLKKIPTTHLAFLVSVGQDLETVCGDGQELDIGLVE